MPFKDNSRESIVDYFYKKEILKLRDNGECKICGTLRDLTVHHMDPSPVKVYDIDNVVILCTKCHKSLHEKRMKGGWRKRNERFIKERTEDVNS